MSDPLLMAPKNKIFRQRNITGNMEYEWNPRANTGRVNDGISMRIKIGYSQIRCSVPPNIGTLPSILQCSCANCSEQFAPNLQVATISILTNLLILILFWQIFADKSAAKRLNIVWKHFFQRKSAKKILKSTNMLKLI